MFVQIANSVTGEVIEVRTDFYGKEFNPSLVAKIVRGYIRKWIKHDFVDSSDIHIVKSSCEELTDYFRWYRIDVEVDCFVLEDEDELC